ncbi:MAG: peptidoglycan DD-metalloendopeptidase family protein [Anaerolineales bacterium]
MKSKYFQIITLLALLASLIPANVGALVAPPPVDMFQLPWEQGLAWVSFDGLDNGSKRSSTSPHNYKMGGAIDFAPQTNMQIGMDTSNFWVTAAAAGTVYEVTNCYIKINHNNGWTTEYWHLANVQVSLGSKVSRNQRLGVIDNNATQQVCTGNEHPGPHLHFVMRPSVRETIFAGWQVNFNVFTNATTFTKNGLTVGRLQPLLNVPNLQIADRGPLGWDTLYVGTIDPYRHERWLLTLTEQTTFHITVNPTTTGLVPAIVLLDSNGNEIARGNGVLNSTQLPGNYFVQIQSDFGTGSYNIIATKDSTTGPTATPTTGVPTTTGTPAVSETPTVSATPTFTGTAVSTNTPVLTSTPVFTDTPVTTNTPVFTNTPIVTATPVFTDTPAVTATPVPSNTPVVTDTPVPSSTPIFTNTPTPTDTSIFTETPISSDTPTATGTPFASETPIFTSTPTFTGTPATPISSETPIASFTPTPTGIGTLIPTSTPIVTSTPVVTSTSLPTGPYVLTFATPNGLIVGETGLVTVSLNNVPPDGYRSTEFTCTYDPALIEVSNIVIAGLFGSDPVSAMNGPQNGSFILAIAGSNGNKATASGPAFTFNIKGLLSGQTSIECRARVSKGDGTLESILYIPDTVTIFGNALTATPPAEPVLSGRVIASKLVTIRLFNPDASLAATTTANPDGTFSFPFTAGTYTIIASADGFLSAQGTAILMNGGSTVMPLVSLPAGDIDGNDVIDQFDALTLGMNYNASFPAVADLNNDGIINVLDLELLAANYHKSGALAWQ